MIVGPNVFGTLCYDADFTPFGGERAYTNNCPAQNYKFEGKERDQETQNDNFGAREYTWRFGRWLSSDWSATPSPVPYANLSNPQTLNLYAMVEDDPESFADLDGHNPCQQSQTCTSAAALAAPPLVSADQAIGALKGLWNMAADTWNNVADLLNEQTALASGTGTPYGLSELPTASYDNKTQAISGGVAQLGVVVATGIEGALREGTAESTISGSKAATLPREGIYEGADAKAPGRVYVGQSENIPRRVAEHEASGKFPAGTKVSSTEVQGGKTAREIAEQRRINQLGGVRSKPGSQTSNVRNPIGKARASLLKDDN